MLVISWYLSNGYVFLCSYRTICSIVCKIDDKWWLLCPKHLYFHWWSSDRRGSTYISMGRSMSERYTPTRWAPVPRLKVRTDSDSVVGLTRQTPIVCQKPRFLGWEIFAIPNSALLTFTKLSEGNICVEHTATRMPKSLWIREDGARNRRWTTFGIRYRSI